MEKEWEKIRKLEAKLGNVNKAQEDMTSLMNNHKARMMAELNGVSDIEEEKR